MKISFLNAVQVYLYHVYQPLSQPQEEKKATSSLMFLIASSFKGEEKSLTKLPTQNYSDYPSMKRA